MKWCLEILMDFRLELWSSVAVKIFKLLYFIFSRLAVLLKHDGKYLCGGTLVTSRKVITGKVLTKDQPYSITNFLIIF